MQELFIGFYKCELADRRKLCHLSDGFLRFTGYNRDEINRDYHNDFLQLIVADDREMVEQELDEQLARGGPISLEYGLVMKSGEIVPVREMGSVALENGKSFYYSELVNLLVYYIAMDGQRDILQALQIPVFITDIDKKIIFFNKCMSETFGFALHEYVGKPCMVFGGAVCGSPGCCIDRFSRGDITPGVTVRDGRTYRICVSRLVDAKRNMDGYVCLMLDVTDSDETKRQMELQRQMDIYRIVVAQQQTIIWEYNPKTESIISLTEHGRYIYGMENVHNTTPQQVVDQGYIHPDSVEEYLGMYTLMKEGRSSVSGVVKMLNHLDDRTRWTRLDMTAMYDKYGDFEKAIVTTSEVTQEKNAQLQLIQEREYRELMAVDAVFAYEINITEDRLLNGDITLLDDMKLKRNGSYSSLITKAQEKIVRKKEKVLLFNKLGRDALLMAFEEGKREIEVEYRRINLQGQEIWVSTKVLMVCEPDGGDVCGFIYIKDIDSEKKKLLAMRDQAERDSLTQLYNRDAAQIRINEYLSQNSNAQCALLMIDLDNFKQVNDTFGHVYGDAVLSEMADRLKLLIEPKDVACRIGGDEVSIFLSDLNGGIIQATNKAKEICWAMEASYTFDNHTHNISCSIGIAVAPRHGDTFAALYQKADIALYHAKSRGKDQFVLYEPGLSMDIGNRTEIDRAYEKRFSDNIFEYIFKILFHSTKLELTITSVLELITKHCKAQRGYLLIYDDETKQFVQRYEWCDARSIKREDKPTEQASFAAEYWDYFVGNQMLCISNFSGENKQLREIGERQGAKAMLQCGMKVKNEFRGILGVDDRYGRRNFSHDEKNSIKVSAEIIGVFLNGKRDELQKAQYTQSLQSVLNQLRHYIYVVEDQTYRITFLNRLMQVVYPNCNVGDICHKVIRGLDAPCPRCMMRELGEDADAHVHREFKNPETNRWLYGTASWVQWPDGKQYCLMDCNDITRIKGEI